jgi:hypothetical protein
VTILTPSLCAVAKWSAAWTWQRFFCTSHIALFWVMTPYFWWLSTFRGKYYFRLQGRDFTLKREVVYFCETLELTDTVEVIPNTKILIFTAVIMSDFLQLLAFSSE